MGGVERYAIWAGGEKDRLGRRGEVERGGFSEIFGEGGDVSGARVKSMLMVRQEGRRRTG